MKYTIFGYGKRGIKEIDTANTLLDAISKYNSIPDLFHAIAVFSDDKGLPVLTLREGEFCLCKMNVASAADIIF